MPNAEESALMSKISQFYLNCTTCLDAFRTKLSICLALFPYLAFVGFLALFVTASPKTKPKA